MSDWKRWFDRYGDQYDDLDEARADFERYLANRSVLSGVFTDEVMTS